LGGDVADRFDRRLVMVTIDSARGVLMVALALVAAFDHSMGAAVWAIVVAALSTGLNAAYVPATEAAVPALVREDDLIGANALIAAIENASLAVGPAIGGVLLLLGSPAVSFALNAATFLGSALLVATIRMPATKRSADGDAEPSLLKRVMKGIEAISSSAGVLSLTLTMAALMLMYGMELVLHPLVASQLLGLGEEGLAFMYAAVGVGGLVAAVITPILARRGGQARIVVLASAASALPVIALALVRSPWAAYVLLAIEGGAVIVSDVAATTVLQRILPAELMGRVFGVLGSIQLLGLLIGSVIAPPLVNGVGLRWSLVIAGAILLALAAVVLPRTRALDRAASKKPNRERLVELLGGVSIFEGASPQVLEALAEVATQVHVEAGTPVITQGEPPDDLWVVVDGHLHVVVDDGDGPRVVGILTHGDHFGEIGLLHGIPRTASVVATTRSDVLRIPGDAFLGIAMAGPSISANVLAGVNSRLARTGALERALVASAGSDHSS
jgi:CRP-like cAMP-binding protein